MKPGYEVICIKRGNYRYRGHIIWTDDVLRYWCCPDPRDRPAWSWTLREIVDYIDRWEEAFEDNRVMGNLILMSEDTANELADAIIKSLEASAECAIKTGALLEQVTRELLRVKIE